VEMPRALELPVADVFITHELNKRPPKKTDYLQEKLALQDLAARMADEPEEVLPRFVDLAMEITGGVSAGLSLYEETSPPGLFRWQYLRGVLSPFNGVTTPRNFSPCGISSTGTRRFFRCILSALTTGSPRLTLRCQSCCSSRSIWAARSR
jgi:predicted acylesterase/phospholipase RssA